MICNNFFNEVTLTTRAGTSINQCAKEAMELLREHSYYKVMFNFNGVLISVNEKSTVGSIVSAYFEGVKND